MKVGLIKNLDVRQYEFLCCTEKPLNGEFLCLYSDETKAIFDYGEKVVWQDADYHKIAIEATETFYARMYLVCGTLKKCVGVYSLLFGEPERLNRDFEDFQTLL